METDKHLIVKAHCLYKRYSDGDISAINGISLSLEKGKIYALMGSSGCGKSTLLNLIGQLDDADKGELLYEGKSLESFSSKSRFRREFFGFVFQFHHLIPVLSLCENIEAALIHDKVLNAFQRRQKAKALLMDMGLENRVDALATRVSGGERQRASIARALVNNPKLILADEPTGNVDSQTSLMILAKLQQFIKQQQGTMLIATHDFQVGKFADVILRMKDGVIVSIENKPGRDNEI